MEKVEDMMFGIKNIEGNDYTTEFNLHWVTFMGIVLPPFPSSCKLSLEDEFFVA